MTFRNELLSLGVRLDAFSDLGPNEMEALKAMFPIMEVEWVKDLLNDQWARKADCYVTACDACKYSGMRPDRFTSDQIETFSIKTREYLMLEKICGRFNVYFERLCQVSNESIEAEEMLAIVYAFGCFGKAQNIKRAEECLKKPLSNNRICAILLQMHLRPEKRAEMLTRLSYLGFEKEVKDLEAYYGVKAGEINNSREIRGFKV